MRCRIRYNPESIWGVVVQTMSRAIPTAIRTCSTPTGTMMVVGSTPTMTDLTTTGTTMVVSRSLSRNSLHFSPYLLGEFCFVSWPFHPPSIFPTSSSITERVIYFLSSKDFVSQRIIKSIRKVSAFLIASRTYGCFSSRDKKLAADIASITSTNKVSIRWPRECLCVFGISW